MTCSTVEHYRDTILADVDVTLNSFYFLVLRSLKDPHGVFWSPDWTSSMAPNHGLSWMTLGKLVVKVVIFVF